MKTPHTDLLGFIVEEQEPLNEFFWGSKKENQYYKNEGGKKVLDINKAASYLTRKWEVDRKTVDDFLKDDKEKPGVRDLPWDEEKLVALYDENPKWDVENALDAAFTIWPGPGKIWGPGKRNLPYGDKDTPGVTQTAWWHKKDMGSSYLRDKLGKDSDQYWDRQATKLF